jgi:hypothetical protein
MAKSEDKTLQSPEDIEKLLDTRSNLMIQIFEKAIELDFTDFEMHQLYLSATMQGAYQRIPSGRLEDIDLAVLSDDTFNAIFTRAKQAVKRIADLKKRYSAGPFHLNRAARRRMAKRTGKKWKKGLFKEGSQQEEVK